jgi:hypothetical protein
VAVGGTFANGVKTAAYGYLFNHLMHITGGRNTGSRNIFGHTALAVEGSGVFSYGNDTGLGSDPLAYIESQSKLRDQVITIVPTTPEQDASALHYFMSKPGLNSVDLIDTCACRSNGAATAAGLPGASVPSLPSSVAANALTVQGAQTFFIPRGGSIPAQLSGIIRQRFTPPNIP